ncbi:MAG: twin-arginine translocase subunit TatC [bacterium]|nr:MAG: twin-arginine translocase subunit TatC [bacterium]
MSDNISTNVQENINRYFPLLSEVRKRLLFIVSIFLLFGIIGFFYYEKIIVFILGLIDLDGVNIVFTSPFQFLNLAVSSSFLIATIVTIPILIYQFLTFLKPALKVKEYRSIIAFLPLSVFLFLAGFSFGFLMMKYVVTIFYSKSVELDIGNMLDISKLLSQILVTSSLMGLAFQYPIAMSLLMKFKVVALQTFIRQRPIAYMIALIFAALMPPTDIFSLILLTLPLVILFELTLLLNRIYAKVQR